MMTLTDGPEVNDMDANLWLFLNDAMDGGVRSLDDSIEVVSYATRTEQRLVLEREPSDTGQVQEADDLLLPSGVSQGPTMEADPVPTEGREVTRVEESEPVLPEYESNDETHTDGGDVPSNEQQDLDIQFIKVVDL